MNKIAITTRVLAFLTVAACLCLLCGAAFRLDDQTVSGGRTDRAAKASLPHISVMDGNSEPTAYELELLYDAARDTGWF